MRYIGSKSRIAAAIVDIAGAPDVRGAFVDAFSGTGSVAREATMRGWRVRANDHLFSAVCLTEANASPPSPLDFAELGGYLEVTARLDALTPIMGFVRAQYSPESRHLLGYERRYLTADNAGRIDAIRHAIRSWRQRGLLNSREERLLIADLLEATSQVANTAGTYGCYLREWNPSALRPLRLSPRPLARARRPLEVTCGDVRHVAFDACDVAYFDPPYTKRQYAAYYHLLETIAVGDSPEIIGSTGLRPWRDLASDFCYKTRALSAIAAIVESASAHRVLLSYSSEGHVEIAALESELARVGEVIVHSVGEISRYRPNDAASLKGSHVEEFVFEVRKPIDEENLDRESSIAA